MKEFRKNIDNMFVCEECGQLCKTLGGLSRHLMNSHKNILYKEYFDKWRKEENEDKCKHCGAESIFNTIKLGYKKYCSFKCSRILSRESVKQTCISKYGVSNVFQLEITKEKSKKTCLKNFGVTHQMLSDVVKNKIKNTNLNRYGVESHFLNTDIKNK